MDSEMLLQNWEDWSNSYPNNSKVSELLVRIMSKIPSTCVQDGGFKEMGFLHDFIKRLDFVNSIKFFDQIFNDLRWTVVGLSVLGDFLKPLRIFRFLVNESSGAKYLVSHEWWIPKSAMLNGIDFEVSTVLGPFLQVSPLPDQVDHPYVKAPNVGEQCFSRNMTDIMVSFATISSNMAVLHSDLTKVFQCLVNNSDTRENVLEYTAQVINKNASKTRMHVAPWTCACTGMLANLSAVMLRVFEPYFVENSTNDHHEIDATYVVSNTRLNFNGLTTLRASEAQVSEWSMASDKSDYAFVCEYFFITARALNLGLMMSLSEMNEIVDKISKNEYLLSSLKAIENLSEEQALRLMEIEDELEILRQKKLCYEAFVLNGGSFIQNALCFYRVVVNWLIDLVGGLGLPLAETCPKEFAAMPEHFVEDMMELLSFATRYSVRIENEMREDFLNFIIMFMASPHYIRNPHIRVKMLELLYQWMPRKSDISSLTSYLFEGRDESPRLKFLVKNLVMIYVDLTGIGSEEQSYDTFNFRHKIVEQLEYLNQFSFYRDEWCKIAQEEENGMYLSFLNILRDNTSYLIDESFTYILRLKESVGNQRPDNYVEMQVTACTQIHMAHKNLAMLVYASEHTTSSFLLPEMVARFVDVLHYLLAKFIGSQTNIFLLNHLGRFGLHPKSLLKHLIKIYVNLACLDEDNIFVPAMVKCWTFNEDLFEKLGNVLQENGFKGKIRDEFVIFEDKLKVVVNDILGNEISPDIIPDEFLDPIQYTLMKDPVIMPVSGKSIDRCVIERHLLSFGTDPFTRSELTVAMLVPDVVLKEKIEEFLRAHQLKKRSEPGSSGSGN